MDFIGVQFSIFTPGITRYQNVSRGCVEVVCQIDLRVTYLHIIDLPHKVTLSVRISTMLFLLSLITLLSTVTSENPWDQYNYSPKNRTLAPVGVLGQRNVISLTDSVFPLTLSGAKAYTVLDFGKEVGGFLTVTFSDPSDKDQSVGLTYSESTDYATCPSTAQNNGCGGGDDQSLSGDHSNGGGGPDGSLSTGAISNLTGGIYIPAPESLRGGFRYLNLFLETSGSVTITDVSVKFTPAPLMSDPSNYDNYFYSSDDLLNKVWYGAAYTTQV